MLKERTASRSCIVLKKGNYDACAFINKYGCCLRRRLSDNQYKGRNRQSGCCVYCSDKFVSLSIFRSLVSQTADCRNPFTLGKAQTAKFTRVEFVSTPSTDRTTIILQV